MQMQSGGRPEEEAAVGVEDRIKDGQQEESGITTISEPLIENLFELRVVFSLAAVANVSHELRLDKGALHGVGVERVVRDVEIEVHLLLMHTEIKDAAFGEARTLVDLQIQECGLRRMDHEIEAQFWMEAIHAILEFVHCTRFQVSEDVIKESSIEEERLCCRHVGDGKLLEHVDDDVGVGGRSGRAHGSAIDLVENQVAKLQVAVPHDEGEEFHDEFGMGAVHVLFDEELADEAEAHLCVDVGIERSDVGGDEDSIASRKNGLFQLYDERFRVFHDVRDLRRAYNLLEQMVDHD